MNKQQLNRVIDRAKDICARSDGRLTEKRKSILKILLASNTPLSAYEITDAYTKNFEASMPTMSIYRILEFLTVYGLVHKLESANKFIACSHLQCDHEHSNAQFLICNSCSGVEEIALTRNLHRQIETGAEQSGFKLDSMQFELYGTCKACLKTR